MDKDREDGVRLPDDGPDILSSRFGGGGDHPERQPKDGEIAARGRYQGYSLDVISDSFSRGSSRGQDASPRSGSRRRDTSPRSGSRRQDTFARTEYSISGDPEDPGKAAHSRRRGGQSRSAQAASRGAEAKRRRNMSRKRKKGKRIRRVMLVFLLLLCLLAGFAGYYGYSRLSLLQRLPWNRQEMANNNLNVNTRKQMRGYWTVAVFGVDSRDDSLGAGNNSDVNMIVNVDHDTGDIRIASIYRDTYMKIGDDMYNKVNAAYQIGGPTQAVEALNNNLDLEIDDYATFNWKAVAEAINILGGVDVEISEDEFKYINAFITETVKSTGIGSTQLKSAGMNHLDGIQAVAYGRLRLMDSDFRRTQRQRLIIELALQKMKSADLATLDNLVKTVFPQIATSASMNDLLAMVANVGHYKISSTYGFPEDNGGKRVGGRGYCVIPRTLASNVVKLHEFFFGDKDYEPSETVQEISSHIADVTGLGKMKAGDTSVGDDDQQETLVSEWRSPTEAGESSEKAEKSSSKSSTGTKASGTKASGTKASGTKESGTKESGTKASGTKTSGTKTSGTKVSGTKPSSTRTSGETRE